MNEFNLLVGEQLKTMDKLLFIQSEIERCQEVESQLNALKEQSELLSVQEEISKMKDELLDIQRLFEKQTEEVIRSYQSQLPATV
ncbi:YgaB family protein [Peribacillus acanthi]|uniref:YgaB family protein n=1 Tax=Peribacillus acanthi TaxID=2171554 RepID=UPI000D3E999C|nr:YgaB family protein [Peribacillus acanthi]